MRRSTLSLSSRCSSLNSKSITYPRVTGAARALPGCAAARSEAEWCGADPGSTRLAPGPRVCSAPLRAALRPGNASSQSQYRLGDDVLLDLVGAAVDRDLARVEVGGRKRGR